MKKYCFKVVMSSGADIPIDEEERAKVIAAIESDSVCVLKQGVINPRHFVSLVRDYDREQGWDYTLDKKSGKTIPAPKRELPMRDGFADMRESLPKLTGDL